MTVEEMFEQAAAALVGRDRAVEHGRIFRSEGVKAAGSGKFFGFARRGELVVKLPAPRVQELVGSGAGLPFRSGGRTMREWVTLRPADTAGCAAYLDEARAFAQVDAPPAKSV